MKYSIFYENKSSQVNDGLMEIDTENLEFEVDSEKFEHAINFQIEQKKVLIKEQFQESRWSLKSRRGNIILYFFQIGDWDMVMRSRRPLKDFERPHGAFVLCFGRGYPRTRIAFRTVSAATPYGYGGEQNSWEIIELASSGLQLGSPFSYIENHLIENYINIALPLKFNSYEQQEKVITIIKKALSQCYFDQKNFMHSTSKVLQKIEKPSKVTFGAELKQAIARGQLFK